VTASITVTFSRASNSRGTPDSTAALVTVFVLDIVSLLVVISRVCFGAGLVFDRRRSRLAAAALAACGVNW
jgi:hypothetical protein